MDFKLKKSYGYFSLLRIPTRATHDSHTQRQPLDSGIILYYSSDNFQMFTHSKKNYVDLDVDDRYVVFKRQIKNDACDSEFRDRLNTVDWSL